ncbi:hypothetical protein [Synechococcus sp. EJ6-Ellesmere]|uniref:hypothetical protein n=1 Tax=Synechococcus sp. EJ6-Ellesmere TaxID=2823734 RepID=UPI0020CDE3F0|nr:hypothetical protein [Synechococcus sp. EJ6-Ellesmere]MCP9826378.1 hypothetical protein [Synechococcus sp. EJ6-Ellesmere]
MQILHPFGRILHVNGPPGRVYTDTVCLAALLLYRESRREIKQLSEIEHRDPEELFFDAEFTQFIEHRLAGHHHHNPKLATLLSKLEFRTLMILPSPSIAFEHLITSSKQIDFVITANLIEFYRDWLVAVQLCRQNPNTQVIQSRQACEEPIAVARALLRLKMITEELSASEIADLHQAAKKMTPLMSRSKYGRGYSELEETRCYGADEQAVCAFLTEFPEGPSLIAHYEDLALCADAGPKASLPGQNRDLSAADNS